MFVNLRFVQGRRVGVASSGRVDADGIRALVDRAATIAANVEELEDWAGLPQADAAQPVPAPGPTPRPTQAPSCAPRARAP